MSLFEWVQHPAVFHHGDKRVSVMWTGSDEASTIALSASGGLAVLTDSEGRDTPSVPDGEEHLVVNLPPASSHFDLVGSEPHGYFCVGGATYVIVKTGVPVEATVDATGLARPSSN